MPMRTVDVYIHKTFFKWGLIVHKFKWFFLITPIVLSLALGYGLKYAERQTFARAG